MKIKHQLWGFSFSLGGLQFSKNKKKKPYTFKWPRPMGQGDIGRATMVKLGGRGIPFMKFFLVGTTAATVTLQLVRPDLVPSPISAGFDSVIRSSRALHTIGFVAVDYTYSLRGMDTSSDEYRSILAEVNFRSAKRILKLCENNRGFYVKAGQYVSSMRQIPREYSSLLSSLQDQALPCNFKDVKQVLMKNFGKDMSQIFLMFDEEPIAAASIAQVHHAVLLGNHEVAVKVQYPGLEQRMKIDIITMTVLSKLVAWVFPDYRFECVVSEFKKSLSLELDFIKEAQNSERTAMNFKGNNIIMVPQVFWELTSKQVLTMQFCKGYRVDDLDLYKKSGINPVKIAKALMDLFAEMIFIHGFVHGDPHPGNVLVCPRGHNDFCIVILDHGIYKELDAKFRLDYCQLWKALILLDSQKIHQLGKNFGVAKYAKYFPVIFTGRTINSKSALGSQLSTEERAILKQDLKSLNMNDISEFIESLSPDFLAVLRTDGLLRSTTSKLGAPQRLRLLAYAKHAAYGLDRESNLDDQGYKIRSLISRIRTNISYLQLITFLKMLDLLSRFEQLGCRLFKAIKWMFLQLSREVRTSYCLI